MLTSVLHFRKHWRTKFRGFVFRKLIFHQRGKGKAERDGEGGGKGSRNAEEKGKKEGRKRRSEKERHKETKIFQIMLNDMQLFPFKKSLLQHLPN